MASIRRQKWNPFSKFFGWLKRIMAGILNFFRWLLKGEGKSIIIAGVFSLLGVMLGSYLSYRASHKLFVKQRTFENQRISYSKVMAHKIPWSQFIQNQLEARALVEYYHKLILMDPRFIRYEAEMIKQNDFANSLIKDISVEQKAVFETLGIIETCFELDSSLKAAIESVYKYETLAVDPFPTTFKTQASLDSFKRKIDGEIVTIVKTDFKDKLDNLSRLLREKIEE